MNVMLFSYKKTKNIEIKENLVQSEYYFLQASMQENIDKLIRIYVNHFELLESTLCETNWLRQ